MMGLLAQSPIALGDSLGAIAIFAVTTALAGLFVASLAYWGYRRNASRPMLYLSVGILLLTTIPVTMDYTLQGVTTATEAEILLVITLSHLAGVLAILYALTKA
ncbi:DUF7521 family protein [Halegenticoccus tardaugens]|uniref:DUF7521 family protein n=1 Tax=Halegenticoccus tardaugens TaxID=2071624 RepID=UPI001E48FC21|nr:hypothetical protein [Halegenticoccus tardaugens]